VNPFTGALHFGSVKANEARRHTSEFMRSHRLFAKRNCHASRIWIPTPSRRLLLARSTVLPVDEIVAALLGRAALLLAL